MEFELRSSIGAVEGDYRFRRDVLLLSDVVEPQCRLEGFDLIVKGSWHEEVDSFLRLILIVGSGVRVGEGPVQIGGRESD